MHARLALAPTFIVLVAGPAVHPALAVTVVEPRAAVSADDAEENRSGPPTLRIVSPPAMAQFSADERVALVAAARDPEDGNLGDAVLWSSSRDGALGRGALSHSLSVGIHTLTAKVQDSERLVEVASLDVQVTDESHVLLAAGDIASCNSTGDEATAALLDQRFGSVVTLGDNAYLAGTPAEFQNCYEPSWGRHKARTRAAAGNHEYRTAGAAGHFAYFGTSAGHPSKGWYSFDVGSWHVVVLNSNCWEIGGCTRASPQGLWLEADLAANPRDCTLAVWHHPRFSSGRPEGNGMARLDLDDIVDTLAVWRHPRFSWNRNGGGSMATQYLYDIVHDHGGDLILSGHDHDYERFAPQDAFGNADPGAPRQFVVGTGGASLRKMGEIEPNSVTSAGEVYGVLALTLHETSYDWEFVPAAGYSYTDSGSASCVVAGRRTVPEVAADSPAGGVGFLASVPIIPIVPGRRGSGASCGIGPELVVALPLLAWLHRRRDVARTHPS